MRQFVDFNGKRYELMINGRKGIMLVRNFPSETYFANCWEGETPEELFNRFYTQFKATEVA